MIGDDVVVLVLMYVPSMACTSLNLFVLYSTEGGVPAHDVLPDNEDNIRAGDKRAPDVIGDKRHADNHVATAV